MEKLELLYLARRNVRWCGHRADCPGGAADKIPPARPGGTGSAPPQGDADLMGGGAGRMLGREGVLWTVGKCLSLVLKVLLLQVDVETGNARYRHRVKASLALAWGGLG